METGQRTNCPIYLLDLVEVFQMKLNFGGGKLNIWKMMDIFLINVCSLLLQRIL